ncbi:ABC transporter substrate-binding protein [Alloalcanivorax xenomutans]|uniref:ABC transporter substrate-binding protein n=1 Tax=Alloalcanivorax xenomutans TaxID=1094342 RepID=UPI003A80ABFA
MKTTMLRKAALMGLSACIGLTGAISAQAQEAKEQYLPSLVYRTGPFAPSGIGFADGFADYVTLINERDGGINGVKIRLEECETGYANDRGVECYERLKDRHGGATVVAPLSTGITYALIPRTRADGITMSTMGYGRADAAYGPVLDNVFMVPTTYWSSTTVVMDYIAEQEGGWENLKGKDIVHAYHDSAYGKEPLGVLRHYAEKYGFTLHEMPISPPGVEQRTVWTQVRRIKPDWISLFGWGVMNPTAIRTASSMGIDVSRMIGGIYAAQDDAVKPAGDDAKGYKAVTFHGPGTDYPIYQELKKHVYDKDLAAGSGDAKGTIAYNRGLINAGYIVEAWRQAQEMSEKGRPSTREETLKAWQSLDIPEARTKELGMGGLMPPVHITCLDHEGPGMALIQQWNGEAWEQVTEFRKPNKDLVFPMYKASAEAYAKQEGITPKSCD